jgi:glycine/D-amino acid oxidase-like deaminating enzyme
VELLYARAASALVGASGVLGATVTQDCARIQPARLARGLARPVERLGGRIVEGAAALSIGPREVVTDRVSCGPGRPSGRSRRGARS